MKPTERVPYTGSLQMGGIPQSESLFPAKACFQKVAIRPQGPYVGVNTGALPMRVPHLDESWQLIESTGEYGWGREMKKASRKSPERSRKIQFDSTHHVFFYCYYVPASGLVGWGYLLLSKVETEEDPALCVDYEGQWGK